MKAERLLKAEQDKRVRAKQRKEEERRKLQQTMEDAKLNEQAKRNAFRAQQEVSEMMAYERQYGKVGIKIEERNSTYPIGCSVPFLLLSLVLR